MSDLVSTRCAVVCNPNRLAHSVSGMASNQGHISETALLKTGLTADLARRLTVGAGRWIAEPEPNGEMSREKLSNLTGNDARTSQGQVGGRKGTNIRLPIQEQWRITENKPAALSYCLSA